MFNSQASTNVVNSLTPADPIETKYPAHALKILGFGRVYPQQTFTNNSATTDQESTILLDIQDGVASAASTGNFDTH